MKKKNTQKKARIDDGVLQCLVFFTQDPVYGKGKLGEIQGLVLGMLDTFNYEQVSCMCFCSIHCCVQGLLVAIQLTALSFAIFLCRTK